MLIDYLILLKFIKMKQVIKMLNALDKVQTITLEDKHVKEAGLTAMFKIIKEYGNEVYVTYKPGKGYILKVLNKDDKKKAKKISDTLFETIGQITKDHAKNNYGIDLRD